MSWHIDTIARVTFFFSDGSDATGETRINIPVASLDQALEYAHTLASFLKELSSCALVKFNIVFTGYNDADTGDLPSTANLTQRGVFIYKTATDTLGVVKVVSIKSDLLMVTGPYANVAIDISLSSITALITAVTDGFSGTQICDEWGAAFVELIAAYRGYERLR